MLVILYIWGLISSLFIAVKHLPVNTKDIETHWTHKNKTNKFLWNLAGLVLLVMVNICLYGLINEIFNP